MGSVDIEFPYNMNIYFNDKSGVAYSWVIPKNCYLPLYFPGIIGLLPWQAPFEKTSPTLQFCPSLTYSDFGPSVSFPSATRGVVPLGTDVFVDDGLQTHLSRF